MGNAFDAFCDEVLRAAPRATAQERAALRRELMDHLSDHAEAARERGSEAPEAEAVAAMGDGGEIGRRWNAQLSPFWLWVRRCALMLTVLLILWMAGAMVSCGIRLKSNLEARWGDLSDRYSKSSEPVIFSQPIDERMELRDHVVRFSRVEIVERAWQEGKDSGDYTLFLHCAAYAKNPLNSTLDFGTLGEMYCWGREGRFGGGSQDGGSTYWCVELPIEEGAETAEITVEHYGYSFAMELPLDWGDGS